MLIKLWVFMNYVGRLSELAVFLGLRHMHSHTCCFKASGRCLVTELGQEGCSENCYINERQPESVRTRLHTSSQHPPFLSHLPLLLFT